MHLKIVLGDKALQVLEVSAALGKAKALKWVGREQGSGAPRSLLPLVAVLAIVAVGMLLYKQMPSRFVGS